MARTWETGESRRFMGWAGESRRILSPVKLTHCGDVGAQFPPFRELAKIMTEHVNAPATLINDGKAGALAVAVETGYSDLLCLGLGMTVAAGYVDPDGSIDPDISELTPATMDLDPQFDPRVSRHVSVKFGLPRIAAAVGYKTAFRDFSDLSERLFASYEKEDHRAESTVAILGLYLAEAIAMSHDCLRMTNLALIGGVAQNAGLVHSVMNWLGARYPDIRLELIQPPANLQYLSAKGAALFAAQSRKFAEENG